MILRPLYPVNQAYATWTQWVPSCRLRETRQNPAVRVRSMLMEKPQSHHSRKIRAARHKKQSHDRVRPATVAWTMHSPQAVQACGDLFQLRAVTLLATRSSCLLECSA